MAKLYECSSGPLPGETDKLKPGIFYWLGTNQGKAAYTNPCDKGVVDVTISSDGGGKSKKASIVGNELATFYTGNTMDSWIKIDVGGEVLIQPRSYCIRNVQEGATSQPLRNWHFEGSKDGVTWDKIKTHTNETALGHRVAGQCAQFNVNTDCYYRHFRIFQFDKNGDSKHHLACGGMEIYGVVISAKAPESQFVFSGTVPQDDAPFDTNGLFYWLGTKRGTAPYVNPHVLKAVTCKTSSHGGGQNNALEAFVSHETSSLYTKDTADSWISVDIGEQLFVPTCYVIRNCHTAATSCSLRNWELQGSVDEVKWTTLERHVNDTSLTASAPGHTAVWKLKPGLPASRYFRIFQFGKNAANSSYCALGGMELYGHFAGAGAAPVTVGKTPSQSGTTFVYSDLPACNAPFDRNGLFYFLGTKGGTCGYQNPGILKQVVCEASAVGGGDLNGIVSHGTNTFWTKDVANSWAIVDIGANRSFSPSCYCLRNCETSATTSTLRNWEFSGSNDKQTWTVLKRHTEDTSLLFKTSGHVAVWQLGSGLPACRYFRILQFGPNGNNKNHMGIGGMELYGVLYGSGSMSALPPTPTQPIPTPTPTKPSPTPTQPISTPTAKPTTTPAPTAPTTKPTVSRTHGLGFTKDDAMGTYKPIAEFVDGFQPQKTCKEYVTQDCVIACVNSAPFIQQTCEETARITSSYLQCPEIASALHKSDIQPMELFAVILYTFDLALIYPEGWDGDKKSCFYCELNGTLQSRDHVKLAHLKGYLHFLMKALRKLPAWKGSVYRGIDANGSAILGPNYSQGRKVHFSGLSSAAPDLEVARNFAGEDGVVLRMKIRNGRDIRQYSAIPNESEILLLPNIGLMVTEELHFDDDIGCNVIDLVEMQETTNTFVF
eukprot:TRINITY_DN3426_c0_g2_i1.p1 TRINITY_DN3426_c0_g2~~TRINITY_DN3426_c0_g2_i1.p1  ORF type:complete len:886 (+),score=111.73 TRINITY_DN3426_c0_g2_i1:97-2754(+)